VGRDAEVAPVEAEVVGEASEGVEVDEGVEEKTTRFVVEDGGERQGSGLG
jgi:hypothetical protein